jgi:hypothetical protein
LRELASFPALHSLVLRGTPTSNDGLRALARIPGLTHLDLGSKWELNDAGVCVRGGWGSALCANDRSSNAVELYCACVATRPGARRLLHLTFALIHLTPPLLLCQACRQWPAALSCAS